MATLNLQNAFVIKPAAGTDTDKPGTLIMKRYTGTLSSNTLDITTDFTHILGCLGLNYTVNTSGGELVALGWALKTLANGASVITISGADKAMEVFVVGFMGPQV